MKKIAIISLVILSSVSAYTQTTVGQINKICQAYDDQIQQAEEEEVEFLPPHITINSTLNKRAIGPVEHSIVLYFDEYEEFEEPEQDNEYVMPNKYAMLRKAIVVYESGSYTITTHYYLDEQGYLIKFIFSEIGYECYAQTTYFDEHEPIRISQESINSSDCLLLDEESIEYDKTEFNEQEKSDAQLLVVLAEQYREMLANQYDLIKD